ncbi:p26-a [Ectropis obliqua nucleopolyhedrovirus]|uniref:Protein p26 n=1 Tax=Ectropis obliqua nucleopolyhedrovirus TaxID=59376 RepID=A0EYS1_9ABAC|nr:p26-a [Ectropis obliqua nucleopolyhedrovirus]ABI35702.1 p26-a [Ectropis obliqua nucleopolyhedrovirus]AGS47882.1 protein p26 [Ectropis obliqua nucleopolyhedrovirus]UYO72810.1 p26-a [Ectropis obliqua nucleopolyhedrovirus]
MSKKVLIVVNNENVKMSLLFLTFMMSCIAVRSDPINIQHGTMYSTEYIIDHNARRVDVFKNNNENVSVHVIGAQGCTTGNENFDVLHHYPGVATDVVFTSAVKHTVLHVLLSDGILLRVTPTHTFTNFHSHKQRIIYGQLNTFSIDDFSLANKIYTGAPIFSNGKLVSVITARSDDFDKGLVYYPVTGARVPNLISGQIQYDNNAGPIKVEKFDSTMHIYGKKQLPVRSIDGYDNVLNIRRFYMSAMANRQMYRDWPRSISIFHDSNFVSIGLVEGEFQILQIEFEGPLIAADENKKTKC